MPYPKSSMAALSLALASAISTPATAAETEQLTFNGKPSIVVCAVLHLCDVELQPGEIITDLQVGDRARWSITPAITNSGRSEIHHLVIRPFDVGLETSAVIATNRRTYHLQLRSDASRYMPRVKFSYPEDARRALENKVSKELLARQRGLMPETNQYIGDLDFKYRLKGDSNLKPLRVYNDHIKTTIELPPLTTQEAPTLLVTEAGRGVGQSMEYKRQGSSLVVAGVFDAAVLIYGKGGEKGSVSIDRLQKVGRGQVGVITPAPIVPRSEKPTSKAIAAPETSAPVKAAGLLTPTKLARPLTTNTPSNTSKKPLERTISAQSKGAPIAALPSRPPAPNPVAVPAKPQEVWEARKGSTLHETVLTWSKRANWVIDWVPKDLDYPIEATLSFKGSFEQAIHALFPLYDKAERSFRVDGSRPQHRLTITEKSMRNPK